MRHGIARFVLSAAVFATCARGQTQCRFYLANHAEANSGILLVLESAADANGECALSSMNLRLNVGDGTSMHHVDASFAWQTGVVYTATAVITAAGPQQLSINGQNAGSLEASFQPAQATFSASLIGDAADAMETYLVTQISLQVSSGLVVGRQVKALSPNVAGKRHIFCCRSQMCV